MPLPRNDLSQLDPCGIVYKSIANPALQAEWSWTERWRRADIGAANGHGNACSVARLQSAITCGGEVDGVRLLSPKTIDRIFNVQSSGTDLVMGIPLRMGVGYGLVPMGHVLPFLPEGRMCAWGGWGGSLAFNDVDRRITLAYVMNKMALGVIGDIVSALSGGSTTLWAAPSDE